MIRPVTRRMPWARSWLDELVGGRPVPAVPDPVEGRVAERRIAAAAQVQVAVPDAVAQRAGAQHRRVQTGVGPELLHQRGRRPQLLHRGRGALDRRAQPEQLGVVVKVVDQRAGVTAPPAASPWSAPSAGSPRPRTPPGGVPPVVRPADRVRRPCAVWRARLSCGAGLGTRRPGSPASKAASCLLVWLSEPRRSSVIAATATTRAVPAASQRLRPSPAPPRYVGRRPRSTARRRRPPRPRARRRRSPDPAARCFGRD